MGKTKQGTGQTGPRLGKVLVVEDDLILQETLEYNLTATGYDVRLAGDGSTALRAARESQPDLILLDVMLPGLDGFEVCRILRRETAVPILMLTARASETDRVVGLEVGADDYLTKPFSMRELLARVKALLRRVRLDREVSGQEGAPPASATLVFDDLTLDLDRHEAYLKGIPLRLKPKEFELLLFLARHRGMALSRDLDPRARVGLGVCRRHPHGGCSRSLAARKDRAQSGRAASHCHGSRGRLLLRGLNCPVAFYHHRGIPGGGPMSRSIRWRIALPYVG